MVEGVKMFGGVYTSDDLKAMIASMALQIVNKDAEIAALKAEVERLSTPDIYYDGEWGDPWHDTIYDAIEDIAAYCKSDFIIYISITYHLNFWKTADEESMT